MPLVLTPATRAAITTLAERAYLQPYTPAHTKRLFHTPLPERSLIAPHGYRISFVVGQCRPHWPCRHLRVTGPERWPLMPDVRYLMDAFRFDGPLEECLTWADGSPNRRNVNILQPVNGDWSPLQSA
jgi:hypothetical protein